MPITGQPLRGLVGQNMAGRRAPPQPQFLGSNTITATGAGSLVVPANCWALIGLWGGGGGGNNTALGGNGGDAVFALVAATVGQTIAWSIGAGGAGGASPAVGGDTTLSIPGFSFLARGGGSSSQSAGPYVSAGGKGSTGAVAATAGQDGGGNGGAGIGGSGAGSGGGGGGGLLSKLANLGAGGNGAGGDLGVTGTQPGGGGGSNDLGGTGQAGAPGQVVVVFIAQT